VKILNTRQENTFVLNKQCKLKYGVGEYKFLDHAIEDAEKNSIDTIQIIFINSEMNQYFLNFWKCPESSTILSLKDKNEFQ